MKQIAIVFSFFFSLFLISCEEDEKTDTEKPTIDLSIQEAFPLNCDTLYFGESFDVNLLFTDNVELGSFSIDIHNNFNHHSHSTEIIECQPEPDKDPVNPFVFIEDYQIPAGSDEYRTDLSIAIPEANGTALYDEGDYHFSISLTDHEGWSTQRGLSIKILYRDDVN